MEIAPDLLLILIIQLTVTAILTIILINLIP